MRTDKAGFEFSNRNFSNVFNAIPIYMKFDKDKEFWLHLDCVFNPIWNDTSIVSSDEIKEELLNAIECVFPNP